MAEVPVQPQPTSKGINWKTILISSAIGGLIIVIGALGFYLIQGKSEDTATTQVTIPKTATESAKEATKPATPSSKKAEETESDAVLLKKVVSEKTGINMDIIIVDVQKNTGKHATGLVTAKGEMMGGGYWLALKTDGKWSVVFDGQSTPECTLVDPSGFPVNMVPECIDVNGNVVTRN